MTIHAMPRSEVLQIFGSTIRKYRAAVGISQEDLAARAKIHRTYIGGIERGERNPTLVMIYRLADALEVPPAALLPNEPKPSKKK
jgi:transcriptional regulator with XRE-family HTH domain